MRTLASTCLLAATLAVGVLTGPADADPRGPAAVGEHVRGAPPRETGRSVTVPGRLTGKAFDACRAPTSAQMADWRENSPYAGVGIYLGGVQRKCRQPELSATWVRRQTRAGWHVFPLWVGPQASCSRYQHTMSAQRPRAYAQGKEQANRAVRAARANAIGRGSTVYYDLEDYDISGDRCRRAALAFMSGWSTRLRALHYVPGVYSNVAAAITSLNFADQLSPGSYAMPHDIWFAWSNGRADTYIPRRWVSHDRWDRHQRIHQYVIDEERTFGSTTLTVDVNYVDVR